MFLKIKKFVLKHWVILTFALIFAVGFYLRFWNFENTFSYGWDQARDAWKARDVVKGMAVLNGPRTGVGHYHLGPLWYYLLAPFYYFTGFNPIAAYYYAILWYFFNFIAVFWVTRKIFGDYPSLFVSFVWAFSQYQIEITRTPWNMLPLLGLSSLIFYGIYMVVFKNNYKWIPLIAIFAGLFEHFHFSFVFLFLIVPISLFFAKDKKKVLLYGLASLPLFLVFLIPNVLYDVQSKGSNMVLLENMIKNYRIDGFHLRFFLHRLHDAFIQFQMLLSIPRQYPLGKFVVPIIFAVVWFFEKDKKQKLLYFLVSLWFIVPSFMYSFYGGTTSEYYVSLNSSMVLYILVYLQQKLLKLKFIPVLIVLIAIWGYYFYYNTKGYWVKPAYGGIHKQIDDTRKGILKGDVTPWNEGVIESYLYYIWVEDKVRF